MDDLPRITTFAWVPPFAQGFVRDIRARWAFEEVGQRYAVDLIDAPYAKSPAHRRFQPFGQVPTYSDTDLEIFESGAIALHICETGNALVPADRAAKIRAIQWLIAALNSVEPFVMALAVNDVFEAECAWSGMRRPKVLDDLASRLHDLAAALGDRTCLDGDDFTVGDLMMVSVLGGLRGTGVLDDWPTLAAYVERGEARPAHRKAMADHLAVYAETAVA